MTEHQFTIKCNLKGIKVSWMRNFVKFNGKVLDLLICTKPNEWQMNLLVSPEDIKKDPKTIFKKAWDNVLHVIKENEREPFQVEDKERRNKLWEEALVEAFAKEGKNAGRITRPNGRRTSR